MKKSATHPDEVLTREFCGKTKISDELFIRQAEEVLKSVTFPSQPQLLLDIQREISKPEPVFKTIAEILSQDLALTAKVMKIVNSPFYANTREISSPHHALAMLGLENFSNIVLASSMREVMHSPTMPQNEFNLFFNHSLQVGRISQMIARTIFPGDSDQHGIAYMAGLFHDCGIPVLARRYPDYFEKIVPLFAESASLEPAEETAYVTNHSIVGSLIAKTWKMPWLVRRVIFNHHREDFFSQQTGKLAELLSIVMLAEKIAAESNPSEDELNIYQSTTSEDCFLRIMDTLDISTEHLSILEEKAQNLK